MKKNTSDINAFTLTEMMIVVAVIGLLAAIAIPHWARARTSSQINSCINNLRQIDTAKQQWGLENKQPTNALPVFTDISSYLKSSVVCPAGGPGSGFAGTYSINDLATKPNCTIYPSVHILPADSSN